MRHWRTGLAVMVLLGISSSMFYSCGDGGGGGSSSSGEVSISGKGYAMLGNLAGATVEIFKLNPDGTTNLIATEKTSDGNTLDEIGLFNSHYSELEDNSLYIYQIKGGCDWDIEDDGIKDEQCTPNNGVIRALVTGKEIKDLKGTTFTVSYLTELQYRGVAKYIKLGFSPDKILQIRNEFIPNLIKTDLNEDGKVDELDILLFKPALHERALTTAVRGYTDKIIDSIRNNKSFLTEYSYLIGSFDLASLGVESEVIASQVEEGSDQYIYLYDSSNNLYKLDISNIYDVKIVGSIDLSEKNFSSIGDMFVSDGKVYLVADGGAYIIDIDTKKVNPLSVENASSIYVSSSKVIIGTYDNVVVFDTSSSSESTYGIGGAVNFTVYENKIYVASVINGLSVVDLKSGDITSISKIPCLDVKIKDNLVFAIFNVDGLLEFQVLDADNNYELVGSLKLGEFYTPVAFSAEFEKVPIAIKKLTDNYAYISLDTRTISVIDISNKNYPYISSLLHGWGITSIVKNYLLHAGELLIINQFIFPENANVVYNIDGSYESGNMFMFDSKLICGGNLKEIEIDQFPPKIVKYYNISTGSRDRIFVDLTQKIYIAGGCCDPLYVVDNDGTKKTAYYDENGDGYNDFRYVYDVYSDSNTGYVYVAKDNGFYVVQLTENQDDTTKLDVNIEKSADIGKALRLIIERNYAYVLSEDLGNLYFSVIDLNNLNSDSNSFLYRIHIGNSVYDYGVDMIKKGNYVYLASDLNGLKIIDVSNPQSPQEVNSISGIYRRIAIDGNTLYALSTQWGLKTENSKISIFDISNPADPQKYEEILLGSEIEDIKVVNSIIYASSYMGVFVIDPHVDDPLKAE